MSQYKTINQLDITIEELKQWADSRETSEVVALAIHAIADNKRSADAIWEDPTPAEMDHVRMAVQNYIDSGDYDAQDEYHWGEEPFTLEVDDV